MVTKDKLRRETPPLKLRVFAFLLNRFVLNEKSQIREVVFIGLFRTGFAL
jgi:hypothetical protein